MSYISSNSRYYKSKLENNLLVVNKIGILLNDVVL